MMQLASRRCGAADEEQGRSGGNGSLDFGRQFFTCCVRVGGRKWKFSTGYSVMEIFFFNLKLMFVSDIYSSDVTVIILSTEFNFLFGRNPHRGLLAEYLPHEAVVVSGCITVNISRFSLSIGVVQKRESIVC